MVLINSSGAAILGGAAGLVAKRSSSAVIGSLIAESASRLAATWRTAPSMISHTDIAAPSISGRQTSEALRRSESPAAVSCVPSTVPTGTAPASVVARPPCAALGGDLRGDLRGDLGAVPGEPASRMTPSAS
eukprot:3265117-Prymnesium_polylepis.2